MVKIFTTKSTSPLNPEVVNCQGKGQYLIGAIQNQIRLSHLDLHMCGYITLNVLKAIIDKVSDYTIAINALFKPKNNSRP